MSLAQFCDVIGVPNAGQTARMNTQPSELRTLFNSLCSQEESDIWRTKVSSILFPHIRNGWSFDDIQFDEFMDQYQLHNSMEGVVPDEEEHGEFPPFQEE